jgi:hypothetical protein
MIDPRVRSHLEKSFQALSVSVINSVSTWGLALRIGRKVEILRSMRSLTDNDLFESFYAVRCLGDGEIKPDWKTGIDEKLLRKELDAWIQG